MTPNFQRLKEISYALWENITPKRMFLENEEDILSNLGRCWHVSFILNKSKIISIGTNNYFKTHPKTRQFRYKDSSKIHSELASCLRLGLTDCSGLSMVNVRINRNGEIDNSKPCLGCANLIRSLSFKNTFYTNKSGGFEKFNL